MNNIPETPSSERPSNVTVPYENNPFFIATNGLDLLFKLALPIGILFGALSLIAAFGSMPSGLAGNVSPQNDTQINSSEAFPVLPIEVWIGLALLVLLVVVVMTLVSFVFRGVQDYTSAELAKGNSVSLGGAFRGVFRGFWGYVWVQIIVIVKILLWSLLFIIPGLIMAIRYSLSGVSYFDKQLRGTAAIKDSLALTKDAWLTTMASLALLNILTFGFISGVLRPGTNAVLYRQYRGLAAKPKAHVVSWVTLAPVLIVSFLFLIPFIYSLIFILLYSLV